MTTLEKVEDQLNAATTFSEVFGPLLMPEKDAKQKELRRQFAYLVQLIHPDKHPDGTKPKAGELFGRLKELKDAAEKAIEDESYGGMIPAVFMVGKYKCERAPFARGEYSIIYHGVNEHGDRRLVKVAAKPSYNSILDKERKYMEMDFVPQLLDSFFVTTDGKQYRVMVMTHKLGYISLATLLHSHPAVLDPRDAAWIARRVAGLPVMAERLGVVHSAITPDHILVHGKSHDPLYLGWDHALKSGQTQRTLIAAWKWLYPREVFKKRPVCSGNDVYMAAQIIERLFGTPPKSIQEVIARCSMEDPKRRLSPQVAFDRFTEAIRKEWGKSYRGELTL